MSETCIVEDLLATYSPDDNKLRLHSTERLDRDTWERVNAAGFRWAPKQGFFVAPAWSPEREDLLLELCGEIGDEDATLAERAAERAERFDSYRERRATQAQSARRAAQELAGPIPFGQPILVGHHSERRARRDAERIRERFSRAVSLWESAEYWSRRAAGVLRHAKGRELPAVRHRRIKTLEADLRLHERRVAEAERLTSRWSAGTLTRPQALAIANLDHVSQCFALAEFPRQPSASQYEGPMGLWSALTDGVIDADQARSIALKAHERTMAHGRRWIGHLSRRLAYERALLEEQGGIAGQSFDIQPGGRVLIGAEWWVVRRVNCCGGLINSVTLADRYARVLAIEEVRDYRAPSAEEAAAVEVANRLAPFVNFPGEEFIEMTGAEWKRMYGGYKGAERKVANAEHGAHRIRIAMVAGHGCRTAQVFITDSRRIDLPPPAIGAQPRAVPTAPVAYEREAIAARVAQVEAAANNGGGEQGDFDAILQQLEKGIQVVSAPQLFATPAALAARMVDLARLDFGMRVLEPSAGSGAILRAFPGLVPFKGLRQTAFEVIAVEVNSALAVQLELSGLATSVVCADFLGCTSELGRFDRVLMNPPFSKGADVDHIRHALRFLRPGGRLVAICANGTRQNEQLRPLVERCGGLWEPLPEGTFREAGTSVRTVLLTLTAPQEPGEKP